MSATWGIEVRVGSGGGGGVPSSGPGLGRGVLLTLFAESIVNIISSRVTWL